MKLKLSEKARKGLVRIIREPAGYTIEFRAPDGTLLRLQPWDEREDGSHYGVDILRRGVSIGRVLPLGRAMERVEIELLPLREPAPPGLEYAVLGALEMYAEHPA